MITTKNLKRIVSSLILLSILFSITVAYATTEDNYKNDNNFLTDISETTHTENGYKTNIIINPTIVGIYANENGYKLDLTINPQGIGGSLKENDYKLDLTPEKTFPDIPDVAITKITTSKTVVGQGYSLLINVTVSNQALNYETFHIIIYANTTTIKTQTVALTSGNSTTITFTWNTTGFAKGNYTISAYAWPVLGETQTGNNRFDDGKIIVSIPCDIAGSTTTPPSPPDGTVNYKDVYWFLKAYGSDPSKPNWNPNCDVAGSTTTPPAPPDNKVDYKDIFWLLKYYGKTDP